MWENVKNLHKSRCRPLFSQRNMTSGNIALCNNGFCNSFCQQLTCPMTPVWSSTTKASKHMAMNSKLAIAIGCCEEFPTSAAAQWKSVHLSVASLFSWLIEPIVYATTCKLLMVKNEGNQSDFTCVHNYPLYPVSCLLRVPPLLHTGWIEKFKYGIQMSKSSNTSRKAQSQLSLSSFSTHSNFSLSSVSAQSQLSLSPFSSQSNFSLSSVSTQSQSQSQSQSQLCLSSVSALSQLIFTSI